MATGWGDLSGGARFGVVSSVFGTIGGMMAAGHSAVMEKYRFKSQALNYEHQKEMNLFNMETTESQAQHLNRVFNKRYQILTLKQGAQKGAARASMGARGIQMGVGSTKDAFVSSDVLADIDNLTMNSNKVNAVQNKRLQAVGLGIKAHMQGVSASNMFATASTISPTMNMTSTLMTGASDIAKYFA